MAGMQPCESSLGWELTIATAIEGQICLSDLTIRQKRRGSSPLNGLAMGLLRLQIAMFRWHDPQFLPRSQEIPSSRKFRNGKNYGVCPL